MKGGRRRLGRPAGLCVPQRGPREFWRPQESNLVSEEAEAPGKPGNRKRGQ